MIIDSVHKGQLPRGVNHGMIALIYKSGALDDLTN